MMKPGKAPVPAAPPDIRRRLTQTAPDFFLSQRTIVATRDGLAADRPSVLPGLMTNYRHSGLRRKKESRPVTTEESLKKVK